MIAPWEIDELWEQAPEWILAAQALEKLKRHETVKENAEVEQQRLVEAWRNSHEAYRKMM